TPSATATMPAAGLSGVGGVGKGGTGADLSATGGTSRVLKQTSAGAAVSVAQLGSTDISDLASGTYTPTLTNSVNVAASTAYTCQYLRVGSVVTVSGQMDIDPTGAGDDLGAIGGGRLPSYDAGGGASLCASPRQSLHGPDESEPVARTAPDDSRSARARGDSRGRHHEGQSQRYDVQHPERSDYGIFLGEYLETTPRGGPHGGGRVWARASDRREFGGWLRSGRNRRRERGSDRGRS